MLPFYRLAFPVLADWCYLPLRPIGCMSGINTRFK